MKGKVPDIQPIPDVTLLDVNLTEKIYLRRWWEADEERNEEEAYESLPEDIVSKLDELTGDMKGRVTVGAELASSIEFGMKAGAFVSIGVTCDSNEENLEQVHEVLYPLAQRLCIEDHAAMSEVRDSMLSPTKRLGAACPQTVENEPVEARSTKRPSKSGKASSSFRSR